MKKCCFNSAMVRSEKFETKRAEKKLFLSCVEASATRGTTALVYYLIKSSLYTVQVLYKGGGVHPTGQTVTRGVASFQQGSPGALASAGRRRGQRSNLLDGAR
jgi:hypothetical protein